MSLGWRSDNDGQRGRGTVSVWEEMMPYKTAGYLLTKVSCLDVGFFGFCLRERENARAGGGGQRGS